MSVAAPSPFSMSTAERLAAPRSPHAQAFEDSKSRFSQFGSSPLGKHMLDCYPALPQAGSDGEHTSPHSAKRQKVAKTSFTNSRNPEARDYMNKQILDLAQMGWDVYIAKMQYQRLRMQELEMIRVVMGDELEETQGYLNQMERQIGQIRQDLPVPGNDAGQWAYLRLFPIPQDSAPSFRGAYSARSSEDGDSTTSSFSF